MSLILLNLNWVFDRVRSSQNIWPNKSHFREADSCFSLFHEAKPTSIMPISRIYLGLIHSKGCPRNHGIWKKSLQNIKMGITSLLGILCIDHGTFCTRAAWHCHVIFLLVRRGIMSDRKWIRPKISVGISSSKFFLTTVQSSYVSLLIYRG